MPNAINVVCLPVPVRTYREERESPVELLSRDYVKGSLNFRLNYKSHDTKNSDVYYSGFEFQVQNLPQRFDVDKFAQSLEKEALSPWFQGRLSSVRTHMQYGFRNGEPLSEHSMELAQHDMDDMLLAINRLRTIQMVQDFPDLMRNKPDDSRSAEEEQKDWAVKQYFMRDDLVKPNIKVTYFDTYDEALEKIRTCYNSAVQVSAANCTPEYVSSVTDKFYDSIAEGKPYFELKGHFLDGKYEWHKFHEYVGVYPSHELQKDLEPSRPASSDEIEIDFSRTEPRSKDHTPQR